MMTLKKKKKETKGQVNVKALCHFDMLFIVI